MTIERPIIAIPMGDPAGIGPEIIVKGLNDKEIYEVCKPVVIGQTDILKQAMNFTHTQLNIEEITNPQEATYVHGTINCISLDNINVSNLQIGKIQATCGQAAFEYIKRSIELALNNKVDAIATAPINKESLELANVPFIGHTEILGSLTNVDNPLTMFEVQSLRIFFLTRHVSLREMVDMIKEDLIHETLIRCDQALKRFGLERRKIAVAGLNPHSGEQGLFGTEEIDEIIPGIKKAQEDGIDVVGPVPADSVFHQALNGKYDAVLSLYHDQGHIAAKMTDFERTISITNDLPFLRTSVDHGTAFDIAGTGIASEVSMVECIKLAAKYSRHFNS